MHFCISSQKLLPRGILSFQSTRKIIFFILFFSVYAEFGQIIANALDPENLEGGSSTLNPDKSIWLPEEENRTIRQLLKTDGS